MAATSVVTVRIDPALLAALRAKARDEGRTVSAKIVSLVKKEVEPAATGRKRVRTMGMFANFDAPELVELLRARRELSKSLRRTVSARARGRA